MSADFSVILCPACRTVGTLSLGKRPITSPYNPDDPDSQPVTVDAPHLVCSACDYAKAASTTGRGLDFRPLPLNRTRRKGDGNEEPPAA
jgi:hypothetical protein